MKQCKPKLTNPKRTTDRLSYSGIYFVGFLSSSWYDLSRLTHPSGAHCLKTSGEKDKLLKYVLRIRILRYFQYIFLRSRVGRAIAQAVSRLLPTAAA
jgi:hypothetical protein